MRLFKFLPLIFLFPFSIFFFFEMFSGNVQFQLMELECAKLETRLSQMHTNPQRRKKKSRKTRWDLDGLEKETRYLDNLARKAMSPLSLYPMQNPVDYEEDYSHYPKIREPHRISEKVKIIEVRGNRQQKRKNENIHDFSFSQPTYSSSKFQNSFIEKSFQKQNQSNTNIHNRSKKQSENNLSNQQSMERKHKHHYSTVKINKIIANPTPPQKKTNKIILGSPPRAGLDTELDEFVDHISDFGKWND